MPRFSFIDYVDTLSDEGEESAGGGLVHAVVEIGVDEEVVEAARRALTSVDPDGEIIGAVPFRSGKFALVSSIADDEGDLAEAVVGVGKAPLLEGERAAVSIRLAREGAELMRASPNTGTADLSFSFEMQVEGYHAPKQATLVADFECIYAAETFEAGASTPYLQAEINAAFDELRTGRAIELTEIGPDEQMEQLIQTAYNKLIEIMFKPAPTSGTDALDHLQQAGSGDGEDLLDRANTLLDEHREEAETALKEANAAAEAAEADTEPLEGTESEPGIAIVASYRMKESRVSGTTRINLDKYTSGTLAVRFDRNLGDLRPFLDEVTDTVDIGATAFQRRAVGVLVDGLDAEDFSEYVNSASVILTRTHDDDTVSRDTLSVNRVNFDEQANRLSLSYNRLDDDRSSDFLSYDYEVLWNFFGGIEVAEPAKTSRRNDITLSPPFARHSIDIEADPAKVEAEDIRAILVTLFHGTEENERRRQIALRPSEDGRGLPDTVEIFQPDDARTYDYEVEWIMQDGSSRKSGRRTTSSTLLFVDRL